MNKKTKEWLYRNLMATIAICGYAVVTHTADRLPLFLVGWGIGACLVLAIENWKRR